MGIKADFREAERVIARLRPDERVRLQRICTEIQEAQVALLDQAGPAMERCVKICQGLCCRNIQLNAVIGVWDLVYILTVAGEYRDRMAACLENEIPFFAADCIFLEKGIGPCILPSTVRAEVCLTTFCSRVEDIQKEIRRVKRKFYKLGWFICTLKPRLILDGLRRTLGVKASGRT